MPGGGFEPPRPFGPADFKSDIYMFAADCKISHTSYILMIIELLTYVYLSHLIAFRRRNVRYKVSPQVSPESLRTSLNNVKSRSEGVSSGAISGNGRVHDNGQALGEWLATR